VWMVPSQPHSKRRNSSGHPKARYQAQVYIDHSQVINCIYLCIYPIGRTNFTKGLPTNILHNVDIGKGRNSEPLSSNDFQ